MFTKFKKYISFNLFSSFSWCSLLLLLILCKILHYQQNVDDGSGDIVRIIIFFFFISIFLFFIALFIIIFVIENLINYRIKNKYVLENKIYNIFICISLFLYIPILILTIVIYLKYL